MEQKGGGVYGGRGHLQPRPKHTSCFSELFRRSELPECFLYLPSLLRLELARRR